MANVNKRTVIENVRIFDGHGLTESQNVVIDGNVIGDTRQDGDEVIDGQNGILLPGLIDSHVHLQNEGHLRQLAKYGVTTALDMATWPADKINGLRNRDGVADVRSAGLPVTAAGSLHSHILPLPEEAMLSGPEQARDFVQKRVDEGSDYIKIICDVPGPDQETLNQVAEAAHEKGKIVVAHASSYVPCQMALKAKADIMTHAPLDKPVDAAMIETMKQNIISVPTLIMMQEVSKRPPLGTILGMLFKPSLFFTIIKTRQANLGSPTYENARASVAEMYRNKIPILAGTDCHEAEGSFADVKHGISQHQELKLLVDAGLPTVDAIRAATVLPAKHFGLEDRGAIEVGKRADLILLREDPIKDIDAIGSIARVWCNGVEYKDSSDD